MEDHNVESIYKEVVLDIETYVNIESPAIDAIKTKIEEELQREFLAVVAPGNIKDPDKVAAAIRRKESSMIKKAENKKREVVEKGALSPLTGKVILVGVLQVDNGSYNVIDSRDCTETELLDELDDLLFRLSPTKIITFNGQQFDIPFLAARYMANNIKPKFALPVERWDKRHYDLFDILGRKGALDSWALGILGEGTEGSGSEVAGWVESNQWDKIVEHCKSDCEQVSKLYKRLLPVMFSREHRAHGYVETEPRKDQIEW